MELEIVVYFCFLEGMVKATESLSPSSHCSPERSSVCRCLIGVDFSCWPLSKLSDRSVQSVDHDAPLKLPPSCL